MSLFARFLDRLFGFDRPETRGEVYFFYAFELFVAVFTVKYAWSWAFHLQHLGDVVLPLGIAHYIDVSMFFGTNLPFVVAGLLSLCVVLGLFRVTRYGYLAALLLLHLLFAARYSQGEIPHSSNVLGMTLLGLGLALPAFDRERYRRRFTLGFTYFFIGLGYALAALCKLVGTGITWPDGRHLRLWIYEKAIDLFAETGTLEFNVLQELALDSYVFATAALTIGLLAELFAIAMWWPRFRTLAVLAVLGMHAGIFVLMGIVFQVTTVELILLGLPWAAWIDRMLSHPAAEQLRQRGRRGRPDYA